MKKTIAILLTSFLLAGMTFPVSAFEKGVDYIEVEAPSAAVFGSTYPQSVAEGWPSCTTGELLKGKIIAGGTSDLYCTPGNLPEYAFDGNPATIYETFEQSNRSYVGLVLDQAYELTEVRIRPSDDRPSDRLHGLLVQGSNDGETWATIIRFRQDASSRDYHIFTPQPVTDQGYIDAGYGTRADNSMFWLAKGGSYSMYRIVNPGNGLQIATAEIELYGVPKEATVLTPETLAAMIPSLYYYPGNIVISNTEPLSTDGSLVGTIIGGGCVWNRGIYENAFDGNNRTAYDSEYIGPDSWVGMMFDEPHALTSVKLLPKRGGSGHIEGGMIQASLDGVNWKTLVEYTLEDVPAKQDWVEKQITDKGGYTYFRYITSSTATVSDMGECEAAEICFYGAPAPAAEAFTVAPTPIANLNKYEGEIIDLGIKNTAPEGALVGDAIRAGGRFLNRANCTWENAVDGDLTTAYSMSEHNTYGQECWVGIRLDAPAVVSKVSYTPVANGLESIAGIHIQGSPDGVNWTTLAAYGFEDVPGSQTAVEKAVSDTNAYTYFRVSSTMVRGLSVCEFAVYGETAAPETAAPETAAPETAAPETAAPETAAPETAALETAAPETPAPETAAPETAAPETAAPETAAPETVAPETAAPETAAPETAAPETAAPETAAPETAAPETAAPETAAPETAAPETAAPETAAPETAAPETDAPEQPKADDKTTLIIGVVCVAVAIIVAVGIIIKRAKRK